MGGYNSGKKGSGEKSVEDFYSLDVCWLYQQGMLKPGKRGIVRLGNDFAVKVKCKAKFWGWQQCLYVWYPVWNEAGKIETREQVIGFEMVSTLNGKSQRPYFFCPMLEIRAGKLLMGSNGFAHRKWYGPLYHGQTLGHFDRAIRACRVIRNRLGSAEMEFATDRPDRPKGMHQSTYRKYLEKHARAALPALACMGGTS
ncbi:hypothetical protein [Endozoicomonas sp.]|uniref:hypothetical protein n=1 Tax=Endozoicomonas sp. TaxID=1892382 RepID=UPI00288577E5|nr:hypothetical protein [Endozoicomonas sp.]